MFEMNSFKFCVLGNSSGMNNVFSSKVIEKIKITKKNKVVIFFFF